MKCVRMCGLLVGVATALLVFAAAASATQLTGWGVVLGVGAPLHGEAETAVTLHPPIGSITCNTSTVSGNVEKPGGATSTVTAPIAGLTFENCNATVHVLEKGFLEVHTKTASNDNNGTLTSTGARITIVYNGFHCIFATNATDIGTITGSATTGGTATLDIEATIPRVGGSSGFFCGPNAQWTGSYKFSSPNPLNIH